MIRSRLLLALLVALLPLGACARQDGSFPSLAPRPGEARGFGEPDVPPPAPVTADPALDGKVAALVGRLDAAGKSFDSAAARAEPLAGRARGAAEGSDPWIAAQSALSELDAARADASGVVTDIEALQVERAATLLRGYPALDALQARAREMLARQEASIGRLNASLR
jgi:hypothetical protein